MLPNKIYIFNLRLKHSLESCKCYHRYESNSSFVHFGTH